MNSNDLVFGRPRENRYIQPGSRVRYDGSGVPEFGVVVHCWTAPGWGGMYDCYVAFFGRDFPTGEPAHQPYLLRYSAISLRTIAD